MKGRRVLVRCAHNGNDGMLEYWNAGFERLGKSIYCYCRGL